MRRCNCPAWDLPEKRQCGLYTSLQARSVWAEAADNRRHPRQRRNTAVGHGYTSCLPRLACAFLIPVLCGGDNILRISLFFACRLSWCAVLQGLGCCYTTSLLAIANSFLLLLLLLLSFCTFFLPHTHP
jgi:hypothetical protein